MADLKAQIDDLQQRIDGTIAEEEPLKAELEQAQTDLAVVQAKEAGLDEKPYFEKLDALPESNIYQAPAALRPTAASAGASWKRRTKYAADEKTHVYWIFARAYPPRRPSVLGAAPLHGRQGLDVEMLMIEPDSFHVDQGDPASRPVAG